MEIGSNAFLMAAGSGYLIGIDDGNDQVEALGDWRPSRNVVGTMAGQDAPMDRTDGRRPVVVSRGRNMKRLLTISVLGMTMLIAMVAVALGLPSTSSEQDLWFNRMLWLYWGLGALIVVPADGHVVGLAVRGRRRHDGLVAQDLTVRRAIAPSLVGLWLRRGDR